MDICNFFVWTKEFKFLLTWYKVWDVTIKCSVHDEQKSLSSPQVLLNHLEFIKFFSFACIFFSYFALHKFECLNWLFSSRSNFVLCLIWYIKRVNSTLVPMDAVLTPKHLLLISWELFPLDYRFLTKKTGWGWH